MGSKSEPPYRVGESWEKFLARRYIPRHKAKPIHEIEWLRSERIRLMVEVERHRMTPEEREAASDAAAAWDSFPDNRAMAVRNYLARTAPPDAS